MRAPLERMPCDRQLCRSWSLRPRAGARSRSDLQRRWRQRRRQRTLLPTRRALPDGPRRPERQCRTMESSENAPIAPAGRSRRHAPRSVRWPARRSRRIFASHAGAMREQVEPERYGMPPTMPRATCSVDPSPGSPSPPRTGEGAGRLNERCARACTHSDRVASDLSIACLATAEGPGCATRARRRLVRRSTRRRRWSRHAQMTARPLPLDRRGDERRR